MSGFPWRAAFFVSLALNLVIASAAIGAVATGARLQRADSGSAFPRVANARAFMQALPPRERREMRRELARRLLETREQRLAAREAREAMFEAAAAEPYDPDRVRAAFAASRAADAVVTAEAQEAVIEALGRMAPQQRRDALNAVRRRTSVGE
ncbi:MAG: periplasmic heavy metal sensor [Hyphomonadaceae bacterium]